MYLAGWASSQIFWALRVKEGPSKEFHVSEIDYLSVAANRRKNSFFECVPLDHSCFHASFSRYILNNQGAVPTRFPDDIYVTLTAIENQKWIYWRKEILPGSLGISSIRCRKAIILYYVMNDLRSSSSKAAKDQFQSFKIASTQSLKSRLALLLLF